MDTSKKTDTKLDQESTERSGQESGHKLDNLFKETSNNDQGTDNDPELEQQKKEAMTERD